jgi:outer membrane protein OmpA-like peptidoglycan-associated protein
MVSKRLRTIASTALVVSVLLISASVVLAQSQAGATSTNLTGTSNNSGARANGQKMKIKGVVTQRDADKFVVRDSSGVETTVRLTSRTSVQTKGFFHGGATYAQTNILPGLNLEVEGRRDSSGELIADKARFHESDLRIARAVDFRAAPLEERATNTETHLTEVEQNDQRLSGQLDELAAVANTARGGARAAQETADAAVDGVNETNDRISALDDYLPETFTSVNFNVNSSLLTTDGKAKLDDLATKALSLKGYVIEITGFTDSTGGVGKNRLLSQRRADSVIRYLVENHQIPLRRIITPYGYGKTNPVADNSTRQGREQNRRVEVRLLVNKGLTQPAPAMNRPSSSSGSE